MQISVSSAPPEVQSPVCKQKYKNSNISSRWFTFPTIEQLDTGDSDSGEDVMMKYTSNSGGGQKGDETDINEVIPHNCKLPELVPM